MGQLTTHVLDIAHGCPAGGMAFTLYRQGELAAVLTGTTNATGGTDQPLLQGEMFIDGVYELEFDTAAYFRARGVKLPDPPFLDRVVLRFGVSDAGTHYHVPLLISPWSYSTYRGGAETCSHPSSVPGTA